MLRRCTGSYRCRHLGIFHDADSFVAMYRHAACLEHVHDKHQCGDAEIASIDDVRLGRVLLWITSSSIKGLWSRT